jgi:hypothetical protein
VREIRRDQGSSTLLFDQVVLSATGSRARTLLSNVTAGARVGISQEIKSFRTDCSTSMPLDWSETYSSVGGNFIFLKDGTVTAFTHEGAVIRNPRTAVAYNDDHVFYVVVDGRAPGVSVGMDMSELGDFCRDTLEATWGINLDGGGSSTMVVNGEVRNRPSGGSQRPVANGMMMVVVEPRVQSARFRAGEDIRALAPADVHLGPGTNYAVLTTLSDSARGTVLAHDLNGVYAKDHNWWKCRLGSTAGWVAESRLASASTGRSPGTRPVEGQPETQPR